MLCKNGLSAVSENPLLDSTRGIGKTSLTPINFDEWTRSIQATSTCQDYRTNERRPRILAFTATLRTCKGT